jgi:hypothetical protein
MFMLCSEGPEESKAQIDRCKDFNIIALKDNSVHDITSKVQENAVFEIGLTILYR